MTIKRGVWTLLVLFVASLASGIFVLTAEAAGQELPSLPDEALLAHSEFARPGFESVAQPFLTRTRYLIAIRVDPSAGNLVGHERILFVNNSGTLLDSVVVRLYQNAPFRTGRHMTLTASSVNGQAAPGTFRDNY